MRHGIKIFLLSLFILSCSTERPDIPAFEKKVSYQGQEDLEVQETIAIELRSEDLDLLSDWESGSVTGNSVREMERIEILKMN